MQHVDCRQKLFQWNSWIRQEFTKFKVNIFFAVDGTNSYCIDVEHFYLDLQHLYTYALIYKAR